MNGIADISLELQMDRATFDEFAHLAIATAERALNQSDDVPTLIIQRDHLDQLSMMYIRLMGELGEDYVVQQLQNIQNIITNLDARITILGEKDDSMLSSFIHVRHTKGRPSLHIDIEAICMLRSEGFKWIQISNLFNVSSRTLLRMRKRDNIPDTITPYTDLSDNELDEKLQQIRSLQPHSGQQLLMGTLRSLGYHVHRDRLRESLHRIDPWGSVLRRANIISRREYRVAGPNAL